MEVLEGYKADYEKMSEEVQEWEEYKAEDAEILVIAHGFIGFTPKLLSSYPI